MPTSWIRTAWLRSSTTWSLTRAADLLGDIPPEQAEDVLSRIDEADEVRSLLVHPDETAGGLMTSLDVVIVQDMTVDEAIWHLRHLSPDTEEIYYLFVQDKKRPLGRRCLAATIGDCQTGQP